MICFLVKEDECHWLFFQLTAPVLPTSWHWAIKISLEAIFMPNWHYNITNSWAASGMEEAFSF
jgi:hypothetical protein